MEQNVKCRQAEVTRKTGETDITIRLNLDGTGKASIQTGIGFFDHMLNSFARHGLFDLEVQAKGDLEVDCHHTIEDTGIVLGEAIRQAVGDKKGICRFGECILPMDETLVLCALDLSGRPYLRYHLDLHVKQLDGENNHHIIEAAFKSFAKALDRAVSYDGRISDVLSTKGSL